MDRSPTEDLFGLVGYQLDGKYNIEAVVARGGFGVVYRARHAVLHTQHAVKVLRVSDELPSSVRARFLQQFVEEARIVAQLEHPAIVRVTDFGVSTMHDDTQAPWMVLEWIEGQTLATNLYNRRGAGGRTPREALELLRPVIEALSTAHEAGIAHRDIKPGNIMLPAERLASRLRGHTRSGANALASRVLDFGIAKIMEEGDDGPASGHTKTTSAVPSFSPRYASPEQASGTRTGPWTDVHALGLILTEMLTDMAPYPSGDKMELHVKVMSPTRPTPLQFGVDVGAWEAVLAKALALRPTDRYADAEALLAALEVVVPEVERDPAVISDAPPPEITSMSTSQAPLVFAPVDSVPTLTPAERTAPEPRRNNRKAIAIVTTAASLLALALALSLGGRGSAAPRAPATLAPPVATAPPPPVDLAVDASAPAEPEQRLNAPEAPVEMASAVLPTTTHHGRGHSQRSYRGRPSRRDAGAANGRVRPE